MSAPATQESEVPRLRAHSLALTKMIGQAEGRGEHDEVMRLMKRKHMIQLRIKALESWAHIG